MTIKSFFDTPEYLAARAKAIEYIEDRLMKEVEEDKIDAEIMADPNAAMESVSGVHPAMLGVKEVKSLGPMRQWVAYKPDFSHIAFVYGDHHHKWLNQGYLLQEVTFP